MGGEDLNRPITCEWKRHMEWSRNPHSPAVFMMKQTNNQKPAFVVYWMLQGQGPDLSPRAELSHMTPARFVFLSVFVSVSISVFVFDFVFVTQGRVESHDTC